MIHLYDKLMKLHLDSEWLLNVLYLGVATWVYHKDESSTAINCKQQIIEAIYKNLT